MTSGLLSRFLAAVVWAFGLGYGAYQLNLAKLHRLQTLSLQENVDNERLLVTHGYLHSVILVALFGVLYMFLVEVLAYVLRGGWRSPTEG